MADAEIIPLGTRGRPGRGTGRDKPSAAARNLAPAAKAKPKVAPSKADPGKAEAKTDQAKTDQAKTDQAKTDQAKTDQAKTDQAKTDQAKTDQAKTDQAGSDPANAAQADRPEAAGKGTKRTQAKRTPNAAADAPKVMPEPEPEPEPGPAAQAESPAPAATEHTPPPAAPAPPAAAGNPTVEGSDERPDPAVRPGAHTADRIPGIPVSDWAAALATGAREVLGEDWERQLAEMLSFLRHRVTGDYEVDEYGFDREVAEKLFLAVLRPIAQKWFRIEVRGAENIPAEGGALVVSNHSGTIPVDGLMTGVSIFEHTGRHLRPLGADLVFRLPIVANLARKAGATLACTEDAERMLSGGELVGVWPEGFKGIGKPYSERYKLQRFGRGGFVSAAMRTGVPIVPCSVVGAEEIYPLVGNVPSLARLLGVPYIPITPFFPWLGPLGLVPLPSKWLIEFGEPIRTDSYDEGAPDDPMLVFNVTDQVRETIQQTLYSLLMQRRSVFG